MKQHEATDSARFNKELLSKIREISKSKGQTISGYIEVNLQKPVERDWKKLHPEKDEKS